MLQKRSDIILTRIYSQVETYFQIGGPDSAVDDPFDENAGQSCIPLSKQKKAKKAKAGSSSKRKKDDDEVSERSNDLTHPRHIYTKIKS